jgi:hypothetical protein
MRKEIEKKFTTKLQEWMRYSGEMKFTYVREVKIVDDDRNYRLYYNHASFPKEIRNLEVASKQLVHKLSDASGFGTIFDGVSLWRPRAYVFVRFHRKLCKKFYVIDVDDIKKEIERGEKSLTQERALTISYLVGYIK